MTNMRYGSKQPALARQSRIRRLCINYSPCTASPIYSYHFLQKRALLSQSYWKSSTSKKSWKYLPRAYHKLHKSGKKKSNLWKERGWRALWFSFILKRKNKGTAPQHTVAICTCILRTRQTKANLLRTLNYPQRWYYETTRKRRLLAFTQIWVVTSTPSPHQLLGLIGLLYYPTSCRCSSPMKHRQMS